MESINLPCGVSSNQKEGNLRSSNLPVSKRCIIWPVCLGARQWFHRLYQKKRCQEVCQTPLYLVVWLFYFQTMYRLLLNHLFRQTSWFLLTEKELIVVAFRYLRLIAWHRLHISFLVCLFSLVHKHSLKIPEYISSMDTGYSLVKSTCLVRARHVPRTGEICVRVN